MNDKKEKYYLAFKQQGNGYFVFDTLIASDGRKIKCGKYFGDYDPKYINNNSEFLNLNSKNFKNILFAKEETLSFMKEGNFFSNVEKLYISVNEEVYNSLIHTLCTDRKKDLEEAKKNIFTHLFRIGDCINYIYISGDNLTIINKNNGNYEQIPPRSEEFVCKEVGLSYKKNMSANISNQQQPQRKQVSTVTSKEASKINVNQVINELKEKIVAQDETVITFVNNIFTNQRIIETGDEDLINSSKANILLDGPTGTGKTLLLKQVSEKLSLPIVVRPITSFSTTGYKGADLNDLLIELLNQTNGDVQLAERGIIALDEFDKLGSASENDLNMKLAVQQELLSYLSGAKFELEYNGKQIKFDTSKITFVGMGAFNDLRERKIQENEKKFKPSIGFSTNDENSYSKTYTITQNDYIEAGLQRELVGRFSLLTSTQALTPDKLERILYESSLSPLKSLEKIGSIYNVKIVYSKEMVSKIAELAYQDGFGARSLQTIVNNLKNIVLSDLLSGNLTELELTEELLNKSRNIMVRSY